jgi:prepilin-type N-terminal cleavage/methylation domain-containing protein
MTTQWTTKEDQGPSCRIALRLLRPSLLRARPSNGFTLLEIVIVLTLLAVLAAASIPSVRSLRDEQAAREPVKELARMAKEARLHAMKDRRPYQIAFTSKGISATRYLSPYLQLAQLDEFVQKAENDEQQRMDAEDANEHKDQPQIGDDTPPPSAPGTPPPPPKNFKEWAESYQFPDGIRCSVQYWHEQEASPLEGDAVKLWVFQPSGLVTPIAVTIDRESASFSATFSGLTADIVKEGGGMK